MIENVNIYVDPYARWDNNTIYFGNNIDNNINLKITKPRFWEIDKEEGKDYNIGSKFQFNFTNNPIGKLNIIDTDKVLT